MVETCRGGATSWPLFRKSSECIVLEDRERLASLPSRCLSSAFSWPFRLGTSVDIVEEMIVIGYVNVNVNVNEYGFSLECLYDVVHSLPVCFTSW